MNKKDTYFLTSLYAVNVLHEDAGQLPPPPAEINIDPSQMGTPGQAPPPSPEVQKLMAALDADPYNSQILRQLADAIDQSSGGQDQLPPPPINTGHPAI